MSETDSQNSSTREDDRLSSSSGSAGKTLSKLQNRNVFFLGLAFLLLYTAFQTMNGILQVWNLMVFRFGLKTRVPTKSRKWSSWKILFYITILDGAGQLLLAASWPRSGSQRSSQSGHFLRCLRSLRLGESRMRSRENQFCTSLRRGWLL